MAEHYPGIVEVRVTAPFTFPRSVMRLVEEYRPIKTVVTFSSDCAPGTIYTEYVYEDDEAQEGSDGEG